MTCNLSVDGSRHEAIFRVTEQARTRGFAARRWLGVPLLWDVSGQRHATVRYPAGQDTLTPLTLLVEAPRDRPDQAGVSRPLAVAALTLVLRRRV
jgi:hypothetical protein